MKKTGDISYYAGKYNDAQGQEKHRRIRCGVILADDQGREKMILQSLPVGVSTEKGGIWFDIYRSDQQSQSSAQSGPVNDDFEPPF